jgi:hypothetical protein
VADISAKTVQFAASRTAKSGIDDSVLGPLARVEGRSLEEKHTYLPLVQAAFEPRLWELEGMRLFQGAAGCARCHNGAEYSAAAFNDDGSKRADSFERTGVRSVGEDSGSGRGPEQVAAIVAFLKALSEDWLLRAGEVGRPALVRISAPAIAPGADRRIGR